MGYNPLIYTAERHKAFIDIRSCRGSCVIENTQSRATLTIAIDYDELAPSICIQACGIDTEDVLEWRAGTRMELYIYANYRQGLYGGLSVTRSLRSPYYLTHKPINWADHLMIIFWMVVCLMLISSG